MRDEDYVTSAATPYQQQFSSMLKNYFIADVGIILNVDEDGIHASVQSLNMTDGIMETYKDLEILYAGINDTSIAGCPCLLIGNKTGVKDLRKGILLNKNELYQKRCLKVIPLSFGTREGPIVGRDDNSFNIVGEGYTITYTKDSVSLVAKNFVTVNIEPRGTFFDFPLLSISIAKSIEYIRKDKEGNIISRKVQDLDGNIKSYYTALEQPEDEELDDLDTFDKWMWSKELTPEGVLTLNQKDKDRNTLNNVTIDTDGNVSTTSGENVTASWDQEGNISISNNKGTLSLDKDGNLSFKVDGDINVEATNITIKGATKVTGTSFECGGTVSPTGTGSLCGIPVCPFTGAPQTGSKATGV